MTPFDTTPESITGKTVYLRLYIAGDSPNSVAALANLRRAIAALPAGDVELEVIDVLTEPERGLSDGVLITPMLIRARPPPLRRVLGSLQDHARLLGAISPQAARE